MPEMNIMLCIKDMSVKEKKKKQTSAAYIKKDNPKKGLMVMGGGVRTQGSVEAVPAAWLVSASCILGPSVPPPSIWSEEEDTALAPDSCPPGYRADKPPTRSGLCSLLSYLVCRQIHSWRLSLLCFLSPSASVSFSHPQFLLLLGAGEMQICLPLRGSQRV